MILAFAAFVYLNNASWLADPIGDRPYLIAHRGLAQAFSREGLTGKTCTAARMIPTGHLFLENGLRVEGAIVVTDTGVVASDDEVGGAHVLAKIGVQHRFAGSGIEHVETVSGNHGAVGRKVEFDHLANGGITHWRGNIARL